MKMIECPECGGPMLAGPILCSVCEDAVHEKEIEEAGSVAREQDLVERSDSIALPEDYLPWASECEKTLRQRWHEDSWKAIVLDEEDEEMLPAWRRL